jgi:hypothetical protein
MRPALDRFIMAGRFEFMLGDEHGRPLWPKPRSTKNSVCNPGRQWLLKHIMSSQSSAVSAAPTLSALAMGTSTSAPGTGDSALGSEITRVTGLTETDNSSGSPPSCTWYVSFATNQGNGSIGEFGLFTTSAATTASLLAHATTSAFTKTTSNTLTVSYTLTF